jgi:hypothetical protein
VAPQVRGNAAVTATAGLPARSIAAPWRTGLPTGTLGILKQPCPPAGQTAANQAQEIRRRVRLHR